MHTYGERIKAKPVLSGNIAKTVWIATLFVFFYAGWSSATQPQVFFLEPAAGDSTVPKYRLITDEIRLNQYRQWISNDAAQWALDLYTRAWKIAGNQTAEPTYYIVLIPEGNQADLGFTLLDGTTEQSLPQTVYIKLDPDPSSFRTLMLHETGHMILMLLNGGKKLPQDEIASIPHTTAALTDRITAFDEGFAIHLETLAVHFLKDPAIQARYNHQTFQFGSPLMLGEYHRIAGDLLSYSQSTARYTEVRDNAFAFSPANKTADYYRTQMEKARDFSELRDANQLSQSEGFHASFFFSHLVRGNHPEFDDVILKRQTRMLNVIAEVFRNHPGADRPYLLQFVEQYLKDDPEEGKEVLDVLLDLSHGVFVDSRAAQLWHEHYLNSLRMDISEKNNSAIETARQNWRKLVIEAPSQLYSHIGPEIPVQIPGKSILLVAFEEPAPLAFDINSVEEGVLRCVPGISETEVQKWIAERRTKPFLDATDFQKRVALSSTVLKGFKFKPLQAE
jgi:hypothetical protein